MAAREWTHFAPAIRCCPPGSHLLSCPACQGSGEIVTSEPLSELAMLGIRELGLSVCPRCGGSGLVDGPGAA